MNENRERGTLHYKFLTTIAIVALLIGSKPPWQSVLIQKAYLKLQNSYNHKSSMAR